MGKRPILFYLSFGHGQSRTSSNPKGDPGTVSGEFVERDIAEKMMTACYKYLLKHQGRTYKVAFPERDGKGRHLWEHAADVKRYRKKGYRVVSVDGHLNAGGGDGAEVWVKRGIGTKSRLGKVLAKYILQELKDVKQNSRGIKTTRDLYWINANIGVPVLVEFGFVDNKTDREGFDTDKKCKEYGEALAKALIRYWERYR
ncbi:MAG: N-acetylmuramoyl-L-alanine amidase [Firmicutes bacterium]|jgi:N-acetylmuramoyl-L-alanine amidase|nr:N-acetylmuramoyl-L-alanine amidase [Bacillota bacterium]